MQQWHLDVQHELPDHTVVTVSYVGSKGTQLGRQRDLNQLYPLSASDNPYQPGQAISSTDCDSLTNIGDPGVTGVVNGHTIAGQAAINLQTACANDPNPYRPYYGIGTITRLESHASSSYNALQVSGRKNVGALSLTVAYTYSHSIDDSSDRYDGSFVNSYDRRANRASSNFDQRHMLNIGYVYDLPFFKKTWSDSHAAWRMGVVRNRCLLDRNTLERHQWHDLRRQRRRRQRRRNRLLPGRRRESPGQCSSAERGHIQRVRWIFL